MRRRIVLATVAVGIAAATTVPALAKPSVPVGVGPDGRGNECVYAFSWVPQCVNVSEVGPIGPHARAEHSSRLMCPRLSQPQANDAEQRACLVIFGP
jgi:hypothetical protein